MTWVTGLCSLSTSEKHFAPFHTAKCNQLQDVLVRLANCVRQTVFWDDLNLFSAYYKVAWYEYWNAGMKPRFVSFIVQAHSVIMILDTRGTFELRSQSPHQLMRHLRIRNKIKSQSQKNPIVLWCQEVRRFQAYFGSTAHRTFLMLPIKQLLELVQSGNWFTAVDFNHFYINVTLKHRQILHPV